METTTKIFKPAEKSQGYILEVPADYETSVNFTYEHDECLYYFSTRGHNEILYISNDGRTFNHENLARNTMFLYDIAKSKKDTTLIYSGKSKLLCHVNRYGCERHFFYTYWKEYILLFYEHNEQKEVHYGYLNVKRKDRAFFDKLLSSVTTLQDSTIVVDSVLIKIQQNRE
jgi:hypothetical protein